MTKENDNVEGKELTVSGDDNHAVTEVQGNVVSYDPFQMTLERAQRLIGKELQMYKLVREVAAKLLKGSDKYYMSQLNNKDWKKPKKDELPVLKKKAVDKLLSFFKIGMFPEVKKIEGGYEVTAIGRDRNGGYIGTGKGICTRYEKKFSWIKASDEEYEAANEEDRRIKIVKYDRSEYKNKQIKTDERSMAHTLISMAEKRARAAFLRKLMPDLDEVTFEGEVFQGDYEFEDEQPAPSESDKVMKSTEINKWYDELSKRYSLEDIQEAVQATRNKKTLTKMTKEQSLDIVTYLNDNAKPLDGGHEND